jgi:hypothetical protein
MSRIPLDVLVSLHTLRGVLEALQQRGQTQITFEGLRRSHLLAVETDDGETGASPTARRAGSARASVVAACIVSHYVQLNHSWSVTPDRRHRLYDLSSTLDTLDWIQVHSLPGAKAKMVEIDFDGRAKPARRAERTPSPSRLHAVRG